MKSNNLKSVGVGALALMMSVPIFAQSRNDFRGDRQHNDYRSSQQSSRSYRENQRVTAQGRISSFTPERDGYRVHLDRGRDSYWVPSSYFRNRRGGIGVGINVVFGGVYRGDGIYVDDVNYYDQGFVRGVIQGIDYRAGTAWLRDDASGRSITIDMRRINERRLRRGDYVELSGSWDRGGLFDAYRVERVR